MTEKQEQSSNSYSKALESLSYNIHGTIEVVSGTPVFTLDEPSEVDLQLILEFFGPATVYRIINAAFVPEALEYGTDKALVDMYDFRRVLDGAGYDVWGVEDKALELGLRRSDAFCGTPQWFFKTEINDFKTKGLGIPEDRSALLIYDETKVIEVEETDGYIFADPQRKNEALLGIIKFKQKPVEFERRLVAASAINEKIQILQDEVWNNLNSEEDLQIAPYLSLHLIALLKDEALQSEGTFDLNNSQRAGSLRAIAERLEYENRLITNTTNLQHQIDLVREAFQSGNSRRMENYATWPDFVIQTAYDYLDELVLDQKYIDRFYRIIEEAQRCKAELGI